MYLMNCTLFENNHHELFNFEYLKEYSNKVFKYPNCNNKTKRNMIL